MIMLLPKVLNIGSDVLASSVSFLVNACFSLGSFPNSLKFAEISPVHKKGSSLDLTNYRPVSVLPSMSKIFEREMVNQLSTYFESILSQFISGFRAKHSCETMLLYMMENIKNYIDNGKFVCQYKLFISKLHAYGLSLSACQLLFSYYLHRKQRVKLGKNVSCWKDIYNGSAQGSII